MYLGLGSSDQQKGSSKEAGGGGVQAGGCFEEAVEFSSRQPEAMLRSGAAFSSAGSREAIPNTEGAFRSSLDSRGPGPLSSLQREGTLMQCPLTCP